MLSKDELREFYGANDLDLLAGYRRQGFQVSHVPVPDELEPPLRAQDFLLVRVALSQLRCPLLIHCSAGIDRTGAVVQFIRSRSGSLQNRKR